MEMSFFELMRNFLKFIVGWPLTFVALFFVGKIIFSNFTSIEQSLLHVNLFFLFFSICCFIVYFFIRVHFWQIVLRLKGHDLSLKDISYRWGFSEFKRYVPGNVWSILSRADSFAEKDVHKSTIFASFAVEAIFILLSSLLLSLLCINFLVYGMLPHLVFQSFLVGIVTVFVTFFVIVVLANKKILSFLKDNRLLIWIKKLVPHFSFSDNFYLLIISTVALFFFGLGTYMSISSFSMLYPPYILTFVGLAVFSLLIGYLSFITPMGLGVREGVMTAGLAKFIPLSLAGFGAIFSRIIFIFSELIFLVITFVLEKNHSVFIKKSIDFVSKYRYELLLCIFIILYTIYFSSASFAKYDNFFTGRFDLGNMDQTVWNTIHGRIFQLTDPNGTSITSRLAFHADFILILLAPFYLLWQDPRMLLLIQTVILATGAIFVFLLAKDILQRSSLAFFASFTYLLNPLVQNTNLYDFHGVVLSTTFFLGAFYFLKRKQYFLYCLFLFLAGLTKEEVWIVAALFGLYTFFFEKKRILGIILFLSSYSIFYYLVWHAIPTIRGSEHFALSYYSDFGSSPGAIAKSILFSPQKTFQILLKHNILFYFFELLFPVGFLPLLSPFTLVFALPDLAVNTLSNDSGFRQIYYQYTAVITPFLLISSIYGLSRVRNRFRWISTKMSCYYLCFFALLSAYCIGPLAGASNANLDMFIKPLANRNTISAFLDAIPRKFSVAASNNLGSHLSHRQNIYTIPIGIDKADIILFLLNDQYAQPSLKAQKEMVESMKRNKNYIEIFKLGDFVVFEKRNLYLQEEPDTKKAILYPVSIPALQQRDFVGGMIRTEKELDQARLYTNYLISYPSDGLHLFARMSIPHENIAKKSFPVIIIDPGYNAPVYPNADPYHDIVDFFASHGFLVVEPQYRGKGTSEDDTTIPAGISYPVDVLNLFSSLTTFSQADPKNIFLWGLSTGGTTTLTTIEAHDINSNFMYPIKGAIVWAPNIDPSAGYRRLQTYFPSLSAQLSSSPSAGNTSPLPFFQSFLPLFYLDDIKTPLLIDQGMEDAIVPYQWSIELYDDLLSINKKASLRLYPGRDHTFSQGKKNILLDDLYFLRTLMEK